MSEIVLYNTPDHVISHLLRLGSCTSSFMFPVLFCPRNLNFLKVISVLLISVLIVGMECALNYGIFLPTAFIHILDFVVKACQGQNAAELLIVKDHAPRILLCIRGLRLIVILIFYRLSGLLYYGRRLQKLPAYRWNNHRSQSFVLWCPVIIVYIFLAIVTV